MRFTLVKDWRKVLNHAWSVKFAVLTAIASVLELSLSLFPDLMPPGAFAKVAVVSAILTVCSRIVTQLGLHDDTKS